MEHAIAIFVRSCASVRSGSKTSHSRRLGSEDVSLTSDNRRSDSKDVSSTTREGRPNSKDVSPMSCYNRAEGPGRGVQYEGAVKGKRGGGWGIQ